MRSQVSSSRQGGLRLGSSSKDGEVYKVIIFKTSFALLDDIAEGRRKKEEGRRKKQ